MTGLRDREGGLQAAINAMGGVGALARALGISQPAVSTWQRVPAERVIPVEALTGIPRATLRPDLYPEISPPMDDAEVDEVDLVRAHEYGLLALLLGRAPDRDLLGRLAGLKGDASPLGLAHLELAAAASAADPAAVQREYFDLFIGLGRGELVPYASYYLTGFLHERPLAHIREDLNRLGLERAEGQHEPEDHIALLCEVMAHLCARRAGAEPDADQRMFERHLKPWAARFFADLAVAPSARFYQAVAAVGRLFMGIEAEAFEMER